MKKRLDKNSLHWKEYEKNSRSKSVKISWRILEKELTALENHEIKDFFGEIMKKTTDRL
jgi:hypothetical protein